MKPLTGRWSAAVRPQIVVAIAVAIAFVLSAMSTADAGPRSKKRRRARAQERAEKRARRHKSRPPAPARDPAPAGGAPDAAADAPAPPAGGKAATSKTPRGEKVFDFSGLELAGSVRMPQLLYFLDRAEEELERASLERRSFVPAMMRSLDEESL